jgi:uncharacterized protein (DUF3084 family)
MPFSEDEIQSIIQQAEKRQSIEIKRTLLAVTVPTVAAILYLVATTWLISEKQSRLTDLDQQLTASQTALSDIEADLKTTNRQLDAAKGELDKLEAQIEQAKNELNQAQQNLTQGNVNAAQENVGAAQEQLDKVGIARQNEKNGFQAILDGDLVSARQFFKASDEAYPTCHSVYEIYNQVLTPEVIETYNNASPVEQQAILNSVMENIVNHHSWGMPTDLQNEMKATIAE